MSALVTSPGVPSGMNVVEGSSHAAPEVVLPTAKCVMLCMCDCFLFPCTTDVDLTEAPWINEP